MLQPAPVVKPSAPPGTRVMFFNSLYFFFVFNFVENIQAMEQGELGSSPDIVLLDEESERSDYEQRLSSPSPHR